MQFSASQIAQLVKGTLEGDASASVSSFGKIEEADQGQLAFLANPKYEDYLYTTGASVIIINQSYQLKHPLKATLVRVPDAYTAFATLLTVYQDLQKQSLTGIQDPSFISRTAILGEKIFIGAFAYIGEHVTIGNNSKIHAGAFIGDHVIIGNNTVVHAGVKIYHHCKVGDDVTIHANTVIGADGFGFAPQPDGSYKKVPQIGNVIVENNVEIGANACIDRATIGSTIIRTGVKIDNLVQIAHNCEIGESTVVAAQVGISGSTKVGKNVMIGGQVGTVGHITIGDGAKINGQSGITKSIAPGLAVTGSPAFEFTASLRTQAAVRKLPELEKRIRELEAIVKQLTESK